MSVRPRRPLVAAALAAGALLTPALVAAPALAGHGNGGRPLSTELTGEAEAPGPGDPDGTGTAFLRVNPGQERICYELTVMGIEPALAAHIHEAPAGEPGPVVVPLEAPTDGSSSACADVDRALALDILKNPADYYVNVHNMPFPGGAVRGQLG